MSNQDALTRLEEWLLGDWRYVRLMSRSKSGSSVTLSNSLTGDGVGAFKPDLSTAIHAALDRAEEAGL